jgi:hypothetical protein
MYNTDPKPIKGVMMPQMPEKPMPNGGMPMDMSGTMMPDSLRPKPKK